jgi:hypothetical protein
MATASFASPPEVRFQEGRIKRRCDQFAFPEEEVPGAACLRDACASRLEI